MKNIVLRLTLLALICGFSLSLTNVLTRAKISDNKTQFAVQQLQAVIGSRHVSIKQVGDKYYAAHLNEKLLGHIFEVSSTEGYNGKISLWLGISTELEILGVRVISHQETPGLGDDLELGVSDWILAFNQQTPSSIKWLVKKDGGPKFYFR